LLNDGTDFGTITEYVAADDSIIVQVDAGETVIVASQTVTATGLDVVFSNGAVVTFTGLTADIPETEFSFVESVAEEEPNERLELNDGTITGTQGDDVVTGDIISELEGYVELNFGLTELNLLGGDDTAILDFDDNGPYVNLLGGQGDDYIVADQYAGQFDGGEGDDTIIAGYGTTVDGGAGNDSISIDMSDAYGDAVYNATGGEGDDTLEVTSTVGSSVPDFPTTALTGGEGSDTFLAELTLVEDDFANIYETRPSSTGSHAGLSVRDFDPAEDTLTITLNRSEGQEDRVLESLEVVQSTSNDNIYTIVLTFSATDDDPEHSVDLRVDSEVPLTASDFTFIDLDAV
jgi:hypothetical protein